MLSLDDLDRSSYLASDTRLPASSDGLGLADTLVAQVVDKCRLADVWHSNHQDPTPDEFIGAFSIVSEMFEDVADVRTGRGADKEDGGVRIEPLELFLNL